MKDWLTTFWKILVIPTPSTFSKEAEKGYNKFFSGCAWVALILVLRQVIASLRGESFNPGAFILGIVAIPIGLLLWALSINGLCRLMFKRKTSHYEELVYIIMAIYIVTDVATQVIDHIPGLPSYTAVIVALWLFILVVIATKSICKLSYWQSLAVVFPSTVFATIGFLCLPTLIYGISRSTFNISR